MSKLQRITISDVSTPSLIDRFRQGVQAFRSSWTGPITSNSPEFARWWGLAQSGTGVTVNNDTALNYSAVWAAVGIISAQMGNLPLVLYKKDGDDKAPYKAHPLYRLLHDRPNPEMSAFTFKQTLQAHVLLSGNGYAEIERDRADRPIALWPLTPDRVTPYREAGSNALYYRVMNPGGGETPMEARDILHVPGLGFDGLCGYSVITKARESIGLGLATEKFGATFFGNGSTFGGALEHPNTLTETARKNLRESLEARHQGVDRAHKFIILEEGMKYEKFGIPPNDAQFLETRTFQIDEIARWFNLPPHKLKELTRSTNNNIEQQNLEYWIDCIGPWCEVWEQELNFKLVSPLERLQQEVEFNVDGLLRGDSASRGEFHSKQFSVASLTPNEIRARENQNQITGGDDAFVAMNLIPLKLAVPYWEASIEEKKASIEKMKQPPPPPPPPPGGDVVPKRDYEQACEERDTARRLAQEATDARDVALAERNTAHTDMRLMRQEFDAVSAELATAVDRERTVTSERDALAAAVSTHEAVVQELRTQVAMLITERQTALDDAVSVRVELAKLQIRYDQSETIRQAIDERLTAQTAETTNLRRRASDGADAVRASVVDRVRWLIEREADRARRVQGSPEKLRKWVEQFYADYADLCRSILRPGVKAWVVSAGHPEPVEHLLDLLIGQHIEQSVRQLRAVADEHDAETLGFGLEKLLRRWEADRAETLVNRVLREA